MKAYLDCLPCLMSQALRAARAVTDDEEVHRRVLNAVAGMIPNLSLGLTPPEITQQGYRLIYQIIGDSDPFLRAKAEANQMALALYPRLKKVLADSRDSLLTACKLAIAGNSIDFGPDFNWGNVGDIVNTALSSPLAINDYEKLRDGITNSRHILYLGDNAGEIVFDRLLIEEFHQVAQLDVTFVVRERPIINDATLDDALAVGMDRVAGVVSSGSDAPATILSQCSAEMLGYYRSADVIIAKGQGNYEALDGEEDNIFFLLRAKCPLLAEMLGVQVGDAVLKQQSAGG
jgi:uncharacterized protein with ATP-grasp and redox domains